ncbi:MAG: hypothetical protein NTY63_09135 [Candidatus Bipolaricaulota bacterium]|nr:hypothetical protein [Candidatus Bipolaricaulota bacterium]
MKKRIRRSSQELEGALHQQLGLLDGSCRHFDDGEVDEALQIAVRLRVLWHSTAESAGLVAQLGLADRVVDTAFAVPPTFVYSGSPEAASSERRLFAVGGERAYAPLFDHGPAGAPKVAFGEWWGGSVISDGDGHKFTRKDLVLAVANTDGGAHVDPVLDPAYYALTRGESFGIIRVVPTDDPNVFRRVATPSPVAVTLRQMGHETLKSLCPDYSYDGSCHYPGGGLCWMQATITPSTDTG